MGIYVWVDGVHFNVRLEDERLCTLVMMGVRPDGNKEVIAIEDGYRESKTDSWASLLRRRTASVGCGHPRLPWVMVERSDSGPRFATCGRRHASSGAGQAQDRPTMLDKPLPKSMQPKAKSMLHEGR